MLSVFEPFGLINGHKNARCNSHPTSDMMLAFRKYGVTSLKNLTAVNKQLLTQIHPTSSICSRLNLGTNLCVVSVIFNATMEVERKNKNKSIRIMLKRYDLQVKLEINLTVNTKRKQDLN